MKRDGRGTAEYWGGRVASSELRISKVKHVREAAQPANPEYEPQYVFDLAKMHLYLILERYSRGDNVNELDQHFLGLLDAWEESDLLGEEVWGKEEKCLRQSWALNLHHYMDCFWLTGLALTLNIPDNQWQRLVALMDNEGEDALLDRVIASRQTKRPIGDKLCFPKAYRGLLDVMKAPVEERSRLLRSYLDGWFDSLKNAGSPKVERYLRTPYWYTYGDESFEGGAYFGRWCIEAAAVVKVFGIDDSLCLDHPNYPGDLIQDGRSPRYADPSPSPRAEMSRGERGHMGPKKRQRSWLSRLLLGPEKHQ
jgi:hypothetical protein